MPELEDIKEVLNVATKEPVLIMFLVSMGVVGLALWVALQAIKAKK